LKDGEIGVIIIAMVVAVTIQIYELMNTVTLPKNGLNSEIEAYETMREDLESKHTGKWVLVKDQKLVNLYDSFEAAAQDAVRLFGRGPYLMRQVGAPPVTLPASLMYHRSV
jgi:hypothetical protein